MPTRRAFRVPLLVAVFLLALPLGARASVFWFRAAVGAGYSAMDDINSQDFSWYEDSPTGYDLPDVGAGFLWDLAVGGDVGEGLAVGFHWDRQYAGTSGNDGGVEGKLNANANLFLIRVEWRPLRGKKAFGGLSAGTGPVSTTGSTKVSRDNVDFGTNKLSGSSWAFDVAGLFDYRFLRTAFLHVAAGYRWAKIDDFKVGGSPALKEDGTPMSLDYSGWTVRAGVTFVFSGSGN